MDIYTLIRKDHDNAKSIMEKIKKLPASRHDERLRFFRPLKDALIAHNESEEESFYVALKGYAKTAGDAEHSEKEHHEAADMLEKLDDADMSAAEWDREFTKLCAALMKHIEREEGKVFAEARAVLPEEMARKLGNTMQDLKKKKTVLLKKAG